MFIHVTSQRWFHVSEMICVLFASRWHTQCRAHIACILKCGWHWNMHVPGVPKHHNVCSHLCWFTESYNSQCVSHLAARFIDDRTNTSIAACISANYLKMQITANTHARLPKQIEHFVTLPYNNSCCVWWMSPQPQRSLFKQKEIMWSRWSS